MVNNKILYTEKLLFESSIGLFRVYKKLINLIKYLPVNWFITSPVLSKNSTEHIKYNSVIILISGILSVTVFLHRTADNL